MASEYAFSSSTRSCSAAFTWGCVQSSSICRKLLYTRHKFSRKKEWVSASCIVPGMRGNEEYDLIFIGNLLHHFNEQVNRDLVKRSARALRPGGYLVIEELQRVQSPKEVGELGALSNLYFAVTSEAGTWSMQEIADWQREANLIPRKQIQLFTAPGAGIQAALKPTSNGKTSVVERHRQAVPRAQRK